MTTIRLVFGREANASASGKCEAIYINDKNTWIEVAIEKETAIKLRDSLNVAIANWGAEPIDE